MLKIPWKNLYSEAVIANIEGLYLLVRPNTGLFMLNQTGMPKSQHHKIIFIVRQTIIEIWAFEIQMSPY